MSEYCGYYFDEKYLKIILDNAQKEVANLKTTRNLLETATTRLSHFQNIFENDKENLDEKRRKEVVFKMRKYRHECDIYFSQIAALQFEIKEIFEAKRCYFAGQNFEKKELSDVIDDERFIAFICGTGKVVRNEKPIQNLRY